MIDLDQNATSPLDPRVLEAMRPHLLAGGNPESRHGLGRRARRAWEDARERLAAGLGADPEEVVFTSGGTEANNLAVFGLAAIAAGQPAARGPIVATELEHPAVAEPLRELERVGAGTLRFAPVLPDGRADAEAFREALEPGTPFATLILAQNETGVLQPVGPLAAEARRLGVPFHTDAVQAIGRTPIDFRELGVSTLAVGAHKFHGPPGIGALLIQRGLNPPPRLFGGGQQRGRRPGTPAVALAVGFAAALELWVEEREARAERWARQRARLWEGLFGALGPDRVVRHGPEDPAGNLPQTLHVGFPDLDGNALLIQLDMAGLAVSLGSACASGANAPSAVLGAMGVPQNQRRSSVRFSFGAGTTDQEIEDAIRIVAAVVEKMQS